MKYLILTLFINCHFVYPSECATMCHHKGVKSYSNMLLGLFKNECKCKSTYLEPEEKGFIIKMERVK